MPLQVRIALIKRDPFIRNDTSICTVIERGLTFCEKVGVDDELVKDEVVEGTEKPDGRRERKGGNCDQFDRSYTRWKSSPKSKTGRLDPAIVTPHPETKKEKRDLRPSSLTPPRSREGTA